MQLVIDNGRDVVSLIDTEKMGAYCLGTIKNSFGNVLSMFESEFPEASGDDSLFWIPGFIDEFQNGFSKSSRKIWGYKERGLSLWQTNEFLEMHKGAFSTKGIFYPTSRDIEELRISHNITVSPLPSETGLSLHVSQPFHVIFGILWFYAYYGYGLKRCRVCGRWFAVQKNNAQAGYCSRKYVFSDCFGKVQEYSSCQIAYEKIMDRCKKRYRALYKRCWDYYGADNPVTQEVVQENDILHSTAKAFPTRDNLQKYQRFLYVKSENLLPRYGRKKSPSP